MDPAGGECLYVAGREKAVMQWATRESVRAATSTPIAGDCLRRQASRGGIGRQVVKPGSSQAIARRRSPKAEGGLLSCSRGGGQRCVVVRPNKIASHLGRRFGSPLRFWCLAPDATRLQGSCAESITARRQVLAALFDGFWVWFFSSCALPPPQPACPERTAYCRWE